MTSAASPAAVLSAAVIGPKAQGRNYGVRRFAGARLSPEAQARVDDFSMSLTGWAILRLDRMAAMFPLTADEQQFAVVRARHLGEGELGPVAVAHMLIVPRAVLEALDWASHRLLRAVPEPEDAAFASDPPVLQPETLAAKWPTGRRAAPKAAWADMTVDANGADPEDVLASLMESISPPEQRARLTGWATTSLLAHAGGLDPARMFKLVVHAPAESLAAFEETHEPLVLDKALSAAAAPPVAWKAWVKLAAIAQREPAAAALRSARWSPDKAKSPAPALMFEEIARACADLPAGEMVGLLRAVSRNAAGQDAASKALRQGVSETFDAIATVADGEGVAFYVQHFLSEATAPEIAPLRGLKATIARPEVAAWLADFVDRLDLEDLAARWTEALQSDPAWGDDLGQAAPIIQDQVLETLLRDLAAAPRRSLAGRLLRLHCARRAEAGLTRRTLEALMQQPANEGDVAFADRSVLEAAGRHAPELLTSVTQRVVLPAMRLATDREALYRSARALLVADTGRPAR